MQKLVRMLQDTELPGVTTHQIMPVFRGEIYYVSGYIESSGGVNIPVLDIGGNKYSFSDKHYAHYTKKVNGVLKRDIISTTFMLVDETNIGYYLLLDIATEIQNDFLNGFYSFYKK